MHVLGTDGKRGPEGSHGEKASAAGAAAGGGEKEAAPAAAPAAAAEEKQVCGGGNLELGARAALLYIVV